MYHRVIWLRAWVHRHSDVYLLPWAQLTETWLPPLMDAFSQGLPLNDVLHQHFTDPDLLFPVLLGFLGSNQ